MKKLLAALLVLALMPLTLTSRATSEALTESLVITNVNVIDMTGAPVKPDMTVVITGGRIASIDKSNKTRPPAGARVIDGTGKSLIPGLWDMHVHWYDERFLPLFIANGVTGVRQMFGQSMHLNWRQRAEKGELLGPRQFVGSTIVDGPRAFWPGSIKVTNAEEARQTVQKIKAEGYDFVKVYDGIPREAYLALADEAKKQGIPFGGHVPRAVTAVEASDAGQRHIEHLSNLAVACSSAEAELRQESLKIYALRDAGTDPAVVTKARRQWDRKGLDTYDPKKADALFKRFAQNQTWQCPTLTVNRAIAYFNDAEFRNDPRLKYMPKSIRDIWVPENDFRFRTYTPENWELIRRHYAQSLVMVRAMRSAGARFLAGTDALNPFCFPGFSLHDELGLMVQAGLTPLEALHAATVNPAAFMGKSETLGTIQVGKTADLVLLDADPLADIANTKRIAAVVVNGRLHDKPSLDGMLANAERLANLRSFHQAMYDLIEKQNVAAAIRHYRQLKSQEAETYDFDEGELNGLGYRLLEAKKLKDAIEIFKLNVEAYPQSANAYDSLADAYFANGDKELAIQNYKTSLELNPGNQNAIGRLKELGAK